MDKPPPEPNVIKCKPGPDDTQITWESIIYSAPPGFKPMRDFWTGGGVGIVPGCYRRTGGG